MAVFRRQARIRAPLSDVFRFHSEIDGLLAVTPTWMNLRIERARGPDGEPDPPRLYEGTEVRLSVRPLGIGPRRAWTSRITERRHGDGSAVLRDEMIEGPLPRWVHTHRFRAAGDHTIVTDRIEYALPAVPGWLSGLSAVGTPFLEALFAYRHRRTRRILEGPST